MSTVKLFTDDISLFFVVTDAKIFADKLNKDLKNISECVYKWKMSFNPDLRGDFY